MLEFEINGDRYTFVDLQKIYLEIRSRVMQANGADLRYDNTDPIVSGSLLFVNNSLVSLFSDCTLSANGLNFSIANISLRIKASLEQKFLTAKEPRTHSSSVRVVVLKTIPLR